MCETFCSCCPVFKGTACSPQPIHSLWIVSESVSSTSPPVCGSTSSWSLSLSQSFMVAPIMKSSLRTLQAGFSSAAAACTHTQLHYSTHSCSSNSHFLHFVLLDSVSACSSAPFLISAVMRQQWHHLSIEWNHTLLNWLQQQHRLVSDMLADFYIQNQLFYFVSVKTLISTRV